MQYNEYFNIRRKGIKLYFFYDREDRKKDRKVWKIEYSKKGYYLNNGIKINVSHLSGVDSLYTNVNTTKEDKGVFKEIKNITFGANYENNKDSIESNLIINKIYIK